MRVTLTILALLCFVRATAIEHEVEIPCAWGTIGATLTTPDKDSDTAIVIVAGSGATDRNGNALPSVNTYSYKLLADELTEAGFATLRYDKRAIGASIIAAEDIPNIIFDDFVADAAECVRYLRKQGFGRVFIAGHSEGGLIALLVAQRGDVEVDGLVLLCAPAHPIDEILIAQLSAQLIPTHIALLTSATKTIASLKRGERVATEDIPRELESLFHPAVQPYLINCMAYDPCKIIRECHLPILAITGGRDIQITSSQGALLATEAANCRHIDFESMTHILKDSDTSDRITQLMSVYTNSKLPLTEGLATEITKFINNI
jgi:pimeloyl-ACP methyl ester carboxylesterase